MSERTCLYCGKRFRPVWNEAYCSTECFDLDKDNRKEDSTEQTCPICGTKFKRTRYRYKYCSRECMVKGREIKDAAYREILKKRRAERAKLRKAKEITCPICGKTFIKDKGSRKYCSWDCYMKAWGKGKFTKTCPVCHKKFTTRKKEQVCCSRECARKHKMEYQNTCVICGKPFISGKRNGKYCSEECRTMRRRIMMKNGWRLCYVEEGLMYFTDDFEHQTGDDWNDAPYEHNAGTPYEWNDEYSEEENRAYGHGHIRVIAFLEDREIQKPNSGTDNSKYDVNHINSREVPWLYLESAGALYGGDSLYQARKWLRAAGLKWGELK